VDFGRGKLDLYRRALYRQWSGTIRWLSIAAEEPTRGLISGVRARHNKQHGKPRLNLANGPCMRLND